MQAENAIEIRGLSKVYHLYTRPMDRLKEALTPSHRSRHTDFYALNNVSLDIRKGDSVGIIGTNGSGKSTLLKIVVGVLNATAGEVNVNGRISALLELGAGFNPDYTGLENIYFNGTIMGFTREETDQHLQDILDFADIGEFIHQPVKTYSSGMFVRLAFATQIYSDPDILIVDEALSVGDLRFQQKCYRAMEKLMRDKTVILVTHDPGAVLRFCKRLVWLEKGRVRFDGGVDRGLKLYEDFLIAQSIEEREGRGYFDFEETGAQALRSDERPPILPLARDVHTKGSGEAAIEACELDHAATGRAAQIVEPGEDVVFRMRVRFDHYTAHPIFGLTIRDRLGNVAVGINTETLRCELPPGRGTMEYDMRFTMPPLNHGQYTISPGLASGVQDDHIQLCWADDAFLFEIPKRLRDIPGMTYIDKGSVDSYQL
ncbi:MAG: ABC transporter ATP-binding protein [Clostridia bacterium]|nr:ABC transporter ATP-binding protein [Clostridia bacterium]